MLRNIVISARREIVDATIETIKKIPLKVARVRIVKGALEVEPGESSFESGPALLGAADLLILEESSFDSRRAALKIGETLKKVDGATVLLLTSAPVEESENRLLLEAADASFPVNAIRENRDVIIRLLYRRFRGGERRSPDAEMVWKLMEARAGTILLGTLFRLLSETTPPSPVTTGEYTTEYLASELDAQFLELTKDEDFSSVLAGRLLAELPEVFWVYVAESLASNGQCEFESIGTFKKEYDHHKLFIKFDAETLLSKLLMPDMGFSREGLDSLAVQAIQICAQNAFPYLYELATAENSGDLVNASLFAHAIRDISNALVTLKNVTAQKLSAEDIWGRQWRINSWLGVLARAAAFAGYYTLAVSLSRAIHDSGGKEVPAVGTFSYGSGQISFAASADLIELIEANPQAMTAPVD